MPVELFERPVPILKKEFMPFIKTVGELQDALSKLDRGLEINLAFLPIEGGHRGPGAINVPFTVEVVEDDGDRPILVHLLEL